MAEATGKVPVKSETSRSSVPEIWRPFESLRREVDRLFDDLGGVFWRSPLRGSLDVAPFGHFEAGFGKMAAVDISETDNAFEITAGLPGVDEKNVDVKLANGV